jgi:hypothetical protein
MELPGRRPGWWIAPAYFAMATLMIPWIAVLAETLPDRAVSANYRIAWVGFDAMLALAMLRTAWLTYKRSPFLVNVASATATLLVVDAWFDVTTSPRGELLATAVAAALLVELPLAALSIVLARRAQVEIARTGAVRPYRWELGGGDLLAGGAGDRRVPDGDRNRL